MKEAGKGLFDRLKTYQHIWLLLGLCAVVLFAKSKAGERLASVFSGNADDEATVVVIDAGHGGVDPGKVGTSGTLEKDVNLAIARKLQVRLAADGITVVMTRETDAGLYSENATNKKREDMAARLLPDKPLCSHDHLCSA